MLLKEGAATLTSASNRDPQTPPRPPMANGTPARIQSWRDQLLDTSKRNRLVHFRTGRGGGVPLIHPDPADLWQRLVADDKPVTFAWQRDLIDLPEEPA